MGQEDKKVVLYVDDCSEALEDTTRYFIELAGFFMIWCQDGEEAIDFIENNGHYDALVTDLALPYRTGHEVLQCSERYNPSAPRIIMTSYDIREYEKVNDLVLPPHHRAHLSSLDDLCTMLQELTR